MCSEPCRRPRRLAASWLLAAAVLTVLPFLACGKQGDPRPPLRQVPQRSDDLLVAQRGYELLVDFTYPKTSTAGLALPPVDRVEVWSVVRPVPERMLEPAAGATEEEAMAEEAMAEGGTDAAATDEAAGAAAGGEGESEAETAAAPVSSAAAAEVERQRELLRPLDGPIFEASAELVRTFRGDELATAISGDHIELRIPLPEPLPDEPQIYYLAVRTAVGDDVSDFSRQGRIVPRTPPPPPGRFVVEQRGDGIEVSWQVDADPEVVGYNLYRRDARSRAFAGPVARPTRDRDSFFDRTVTVGETYIYSVTAILSRQPLIESAITEVREVDYRDRFPPPVPGSLVALAEEGRVRVVWEDSDAPDLAGYLVSRRSGDGDFVRLTAEPWTPTEYPDTDVTPGVTYDYRVVAVDGSGNESEAAEASTEAR
jgi:hypothetical protein